MLFTSTVYGQVKTNGKMETTSKYETITLGAGCFWCVEAIYSRVNGVISATSGYSGGKIANPTYNEVCSGETGHVEVVQVVYDPTVVPLAKILEIYFKTHDPTQLNRQGADIGEQYRSVIFYQNDNQKKIATEVKEMLGKASIWSNPIVTTIEPLTNFYKAENYHQDYFENNPNQPYCQMVVNPKVEKFEKLFKDYLKK
ncbi:MAG TPA: peptide-methionine (S)-S-oxide reductase [Bacteroidales bacterium]|nr:peptide-methionine (S)-S-oxide reductase [Bacteroidales bacterium]